MASTSALAFLIFAGCAGALVLACLAVARLLRRPTKSREASHQAVDTSRSPANPGRRHLTIPFHRLIAVAVVFQAVIVLLFAWATPLRRIIEAGNQTALAGLGAFVVIIATGYVYVWSQGGFDWDPPKRESSAQEPGEWDGGS